jgi:hypothetical protein
MLSVIAMNIVVQCHCNEYCYADCQCYEYCYADCQCYEYCYARCHIFCSLKFIKWSKLRKNINRKKIKFKSEILF